MSGRRHVIVHDADTVATVLDTDTQATRLQGGLPCAEGIPFGHKVALQAMPCGAPVVKYGVAIGVATQAIAPGEHVHVHNCR
jgi:SAF domain